MDIISSRPGARVPASKQGTPAAWQLPLALAIAAIAVPVLPETTQAKTPGSTYCFYGKCHRVKSIAETEALVGSEEMVSTSFYDSCANDRYNPCGLTSSGEVFRPDAADNAASPIYPDGTTLLVWSPESREAVVLRVNNAGPYWGARRLDVSKGVALRLGFDGRGVADLAVRVIDAPGEDEATYKKHRTYDPVPGYIGQYDSLDAAHAGMAAVMGLEAIAASVFAPLSGGAIIAARAEQATQAQTIEVAVAPEAVVVAKMPSQVVADAEDKAKREAVEKAYEAANKTVVAAAETEAKPEVKQEPVKVAELEPVKVAEADTSSDASTAADNTVTAESEDKPQAKSRTRAADQARPTRSARVAAKKQSTPRAAQRKRNPAVASASEKPRGRWVAGDPNDISMFSRYRAKG